MPADAATAQEALLDQAEQLFSSHEYAAGANLVWQAAFEAVQQAAAVYSCHEPTLAKGRHQWVEVH